MLMPDNTIKMMSLEELHVSTAQHVLERRSYIVFALLYGTLSPLQLPDPSLTPKMEMRPDTQKKTQMEHKETTRMLFTFLLTIDKD